MKLLGAILAGGHARRFGSDKAEAVLNGRTLLAHVADALRQRCDALVLCGRTHPDWTSLEDRPRSGLGPLGGLCAALKYGQAAGFTAVLSAPCDSPDLPPDLLDRLSEASPTYVVSLPVVGLWPCRLAEQLGSWLDRADDRSIRAWARSVSATPVDLGYKLGNINTRDDLRAFEAPRTSLS